MPFTQDLAASLASGGRASTRNFVSPLPHHSVHSCTYTHLYLYTIPLLYFFSFFSPQRVCLCCACFMFTVSRLFCPVLEHLDSNHPQTRHPPAFLFSENLALLDTTDWGLPNSTPLPACTAYQTGHHSANLCTPLHPCNSLAETVLPTWIEADLYRMLISFHIPLLLHPTLSR